MRILPLLLGIMEESSKFRRILPLFPKKGKNPLEFGGIFASSNIPPN